MRVLSVARAVREMGPAWASSRIVYGLCQRTGVLKKRFPPVCVQNALSDALGVPFEGLALRLAADWRAHGGCFFLDADIAGCRRYIDKPDDVISSADKLLQGHITSFSKWDASIGFPPDWLRNSVDGVTYPAERHWSEIPDLSESYGDIKYVWEVSRFGYVFLLVRAFALTGDTKYANAFWTLVESWIDANPPELGPNWKCGQEIAIRSLAWVFGLYAFARCQASSDLRIGRLIAYLWYNALHIEKNHWYAVRCVRNNHSLSEAAGLYTIGVLLPFLPRAVGWRAIGYEDLIREISWQVYSDGSYVQHSTNYARLVVQLLTWCIRVSQVNDEVLSSTLVGKARDLMRFLLALQDEISGRLPNYGSNDGSLLFPLSSCDYLDYRPALNALSIVIDGRPLYGLGPWSEEAAWFCGAEVAAQMSVDLPASSSPISIDADTDLPAAKSFPSEGYYVLNASDMHVLMRCGRHQDRPAQADMLHVDVWYRGHNVLIDSGTYSYNPRGGWNEHFTSTMAHNTVSVDDQSQMNRLGHFLWTNWVHGRTLQHGRLGDAEIVVGEHLGYSPVVHRRLIALSCCGLLVIDRLFGDKVPHKYSLHWLADDLPVIASKHGATLSVGDDTLQIRIGCSEPYSGTWVRASEVERRGWQSLYYGELLPAWSYRADSRSSKALWFATLVEPARGPTQPLGALSWQDIEETMGKWRASSAIPILMQ